MELKSGVAKLYRKILNRLYPKSALVRHAFRAAHQEEVTLEKRHAEEMREIARVARDLLLRHKTVLFILQSIRAKGEKALRRGERSLMDRLWTSENPLRVELSPPNLNVVMDGQGRPRLESVIVTLKVDNRPFQGLMVELRGARIDIYEALYEGVNFEKRHGNALASFTTDAGMNMDEKAARFLGRFALKDLKIKDVGDSFLSRVRVRMRVARSLAEAVRHPQTVNALG